TGACDACLFGDILERAVAAIAVKPVGFSGRSRCMMSDPFKRSRVYQVKIHQPVPVKIEPNSARAVRFKNIGDARVAVLVNETDVCLRSDIFKHIVFVGNHRWCEGQGVNGSARCARRGPGHGTLEGHNYGHSQHEQNSDDESSFPEVPLGFHKRAAKKTTAKSNFWICLILCCAVECLRTSGSPLSLFGAF